MPLLFMLPDISLHKGGRMREGDPVYRSTSIQTICRKIQLFSQKKVEEEKVTNREGAIIVNFPFASVV